MDAFTGKGTTYIFMYLNFTAEKRLQCGFCLGADFSAPGNTSQPKNDWIKTTVAFEGNASKWILSEISVTFL